MKKIYEFKKGRKIAIHWEKGSSTCSISQRYKPFDVVTRTYKKTIREREDAGGGCYWANSWETRVVEVTDYLVYSNGELIGEISMNTTMFLRSNTWHLIPKKDITIELNYTEPE